MGGKEMQEVYLATLSSIKASLTFQLPLYVWSMLKTYVLIVSTKLATDVRLAYTWTVITNFFSLIDN